MMPGTSVMAASVVPMAELRMAMVSAFKDYAVPMQLTQAGFAFMMRQRGLDRQASFVAYVGDTLAAIWLVSCEGDAAYLISSGTVPAYRGKGLAAAMAARCFSHLRARGVRTFQTEVMVGNAAASHLYEKLGMAQSRALACYDLERVDGEMRDVQKVAWSDIRAEASRSRDWDPSWQNSDAALDRITDDVTAVATFEGGALAGYAALIRPTSVVAQIAVRKDLRRQGKGRALLMALWREAAALRILNADAADRGFAEFIRSVGATPSVTQRELISLL